MLNACLKKRKLRKERIKAQWSPWLLRFKLSDYYRFNSLYLLILTTQVCLIVTCSSCRQGIILWVHPLWDKEKYNFCVLGWFDVNFGTGLIYPVNLNIHSNLNRSLVQRCGWKGTILYSFSLKWLLFFAWYFFFWYWSYDWLYQYLPKQLTSTQRFFFFLDYGWTRPTAQTTRVFKDVEAEFL